MEAIREMWPVMNRNEMSESDTWKMMEGCTVSLARLLPFSLDADRAPQLKASGEWLRARTHYD
jgi:hypothetical protein